MVNGKTQQHQHNARLSVSAVYVVLACFLLLVAILFVGMYLRTFFLEASAEIAIRTIFLLAGIFGLAGVRKILSMHIVVSHSKRVFPIQRRLFQKDKDACFVMAALCRRGKHAYDQSKRTT